MTIAGLLIRILAGLALGSLLNASHGPFNDAFSRFSHTRDVDAGWRYNIAPSSGPYASQVQYDSVGRMTDTWLLHSTSPSAAYVQSHVNYYAGNSPYWGEPSSVVEDYGSGKLNRTTQTTSYDSSGKPLTTVDAAGHIFATTYADADGRIDNVTRTDCTPNQLIVKYQYYGTGLANGQVSSVTDGLTSVGSVPFYDSFTYSGTLPFDGSAHGGGDVGQVTSTAEYWPWDHSGTSPAYSVGYSYTGAGDRNVVTYTTDYGTKEVQYADYCSVGSPGSPSRAFQTLRNLNSSFVPNYEEIHYQFDGGGGLEASGFAQLPATGFTPSSGNPWYDATHLPRTRARVVYDNDAGNRLQNLYYYWDTFNTSTLSYGTSNIQGYNCAYDTATTLKSSQTPYTGSGTSWNAMHAAETYGYDSTRDFLTSTNANDGLSGASQTWSYDAAGNRNDAVVDNLNRATSVGGVTCNNDLLGNRLSKGTSTIGWDVLNRMASYTTTAYGTNTYSYRADGLRVKRYMPANSASSNPTTVSYAYDGQMGFEDVSVNSGTTSVTDYTLGARGIDRWVAPTGTYFAIYDPHGNQVSFISRNGATFWQAAQRSFDPWGVMRNGAPGFWQPFNRYCGSLEHKNDDESSMIYMRARYYDQGSGRFASQDPAKQGSNWWAYCTNDPVNRVDSSGKVDNIFQGSAFQAWQYLNYSFKYCLDQFFNNGGQNPAAVIAILMQYLNSLSAITNTATVASDMDTNAGGMVGQPLSGEEAGMQIEIDEGMMAVKAGGWAQARIIGFAIREQLQIMISILQESIE